MKKRIDYLLKNNRLPQSILVVGKKQHNTFKEAFYIVSSLLETSVDNNTFNPDFLYIDLEEKKKNISIEQIRNAKEFCSLSPQQGERKVVLINNVELMSIAAANSLLKILEEPLDNRYFILITENKNKLLPTILSRCVIFRVKPFLCESSSMFPYNDKYSEDLLEIFINISRKSFSAIYFIELFNNGIKNYSSFENLLKTLISLNAYILEEKNDYNKKRINLIESLMNVLGVLRFNISGKYLITLIAYFLSEKKFEKGVLTFE